MFFAEDDPTRELFGTRVDRIVITGFELIDNFIIDLLLFISDHWVALMLLVFVISYLIYSKFEDRAKLRKIDVVTKNKLRTLNKSKVTKLTDKLYMKMGIVGGGYKAAQGNLYLLETRYEEIVNHSRKQISFEKELLEEKESLLDIQEELARNKSNDITNPEVMSKLENEFKITNDRIDFLEEQLTRKFSPQVLRKKTETYAMLTNSREIIALRRTDLSEQESLKSQAQQKKIIQLDWTKQQKLYNYIMGFMGCYILVVMSLMFTGDDGSFLLKFENLAFIILVIAVPVMENAILRGQDGYALTLRTTSLGHEVFKFYNGSSKTLETITLPVYLCEIHWDESINIENTVNINTETLAENVNDDSKNQVSYLSTEKANLEADNQMLINLLNEKDKKINNMELKADQRYNDGLFDNVTSKPLIRAEESQYGSGSINNAKYLTIIVITIVSALLVYIIFNSISGAFAGGSSVTFDLTTFAIWSIIIIGALVFLLSISSRIFPR